MAGPLGFGRRRSTSPSDSVGIPPTCSVPMRYSSSSTSTRSFSPGEKLLVDVELLEYLIGTEQVGGIPTESLGLVERRRPKPRGPAISPRTPRSLLAKDRKHRSCPTGRAEDRTLSAHRCRLSSSR